MRRKTHWYFYPLVFAILGFGIFIAVYDIQIPKTTVEKEIGYDKLQK